MPNEEWGRFQPMKEHYDNEEFNSYKDGPGANLDRNLQVGHKGEKMVGLFISNLPSGIKSDGIRSLFRTNAEPQSVYIDKNQRFAIANFDSLRKADSAIQDLNDKPPYNLQIKFARTQEEKLKLRKEHQMSEELSKEQPIEFERIPFRQEVPKSPISVGKGRGFTIGEMKYPGCDFDDEPHPTVSYYKSKCEVKTDGKCFSLGRGYKHFSGGDPFLGMNKGKQFTYSSSIVDEKSMVETGLDIIQHERNLNIGECKVCNKKTTILCSRCLLVYYCDSRCQSKDWELHRSVCAASTIVENKDKLDKTSDKETTYTERKQGWNRGISSSDEEKNVSKQKLTVPHDKDERPVYNKTNTGRGNRGGCSSDDEKSVKRNNFSNNSKYSPNEKQKLTISHETQLTKKIGDVNEFVEHLNVKESTFTEVVKFDMDIDKTRLWVTKHDTFDKYKEIHDKLQEIGVTADTCSSPVVGQLYLTIFEDRWYRVRVLSTNNSIHTVLFVDYGNVEQYKSSQLKTLPQQMRTVADFAFPIRYQDRNIQDFKIEPLFVRAISRDDDGTYVVVKGGTEPVICEKYLLPEQLKVSPQALLTHEWVVKKLKVGEEGSFVLTKHIDKVYSVCVSIGEYEQELIELFDIDVTSRSPIKANVGDLVLTEKGVRGEVLAFNESKYKLVLVDFGKTDLFNNVYPITDHEKSIPCFGARLTIQNKEFGCELEEVDFKVVSVVEESSYKVQVLSKETCVGVGLLELWVQPPSLSNNSTYVLLSLFNFSSVYMYDTNAGEREKLAKLNNEVASMCSKNSCYTTCPQVGQLVCARFKQDNCYYRARVLNMRPRDDPVEVRVLFVDFGDRQTTSITDLKPLHQHLQLVPYLAIEVKLSNVPTDTASDDATRYVKELITNEVPLILGQTDVSTEGEVQLVEKETKRNVNKHLINLLKPEFERALDSKVKAYPMETFKVDDLKVLSIQCGGINDLVLLHADRRSLSQGLLFCCQFNDTYKYLSTNLHQQIQKYCSTIDGNPYKPMPDELCLAKYEDCWYRATCLGHDESTCQLMFIDYGNCEVVKTEFVRKMIKDFVELPAVAALCTLKGGEKLKDSNKLDEVTQIITQMLLQTITATVAQTEDNYIVELDSVKSLLI